MLRHGRTKGLLSSTSQSFEAWMRLNDVTLHDIRPGLVPSKGAGLIASRSITNPEEGSTCLLTVPQDLILSLERIREHAKADRDLREVLDCAGTFAQTARGAILIFLLVQFSTACASECGNVGVHSPFIEYIKTLPAESLPTTWTRDELALLIGTTLAPATTHKLKSLHNEYDQLCSTASQTRWFDKVSQWLSFDDWVQVDAMYRSRALEYPGIGHCMVPCLDLANHESGDGTIAMYELDTDSNAILILRDGKQLAEGDEVNISYGDEKGACEMLFSYGFLEHTMQSAEALFLDLSPAGDDPFARQKRTIADCAPGVKLIDAEDDEIDWQGDFVWLLCVNHDDGLHFDLAKLTDGTEEVQAFFGEHELKEGAAGLRRLLSQSSLWEVYRLRAVAILQQRVFEQLQVLHGTQEMIQDRAHGQDTNIATDRYNLAMSLRELEFDFLNRAYEDLERQKIGLAGSDVVRTYLAAVNTDAADNDIEDFA